MKVKKYSDDFSDKKYVIKKRRIKFISVGLSAALLASGAAYYLNNTHNNYNFTTTYSYSDSSTQNYVDDGIAFSIKSGDDPVINKNTESRNIIITKSNFSNYLYYINSLDDSYCYEQLYCIKDALSKYTSNAKVAHSHDITNGTGILTSDMLYKKVLENNKIEFDKNNPNGNSALKKLKDSYVKEICEMVVDCINEEIKLNPDIDKSEIFCILYNLKITGRNVTFDNAYYDENNVLVVDEDNIKNYQFFNDNVDAFRQVIYHETMHIIQSYCEDNKKENEFKMGICSEYKDLDVNPFYWSWMLEAAAEKEMSNVLNEETSTYSAPIGYYDSIILCSILNENIEVKDVNNICFNKQTESLFNIFNASSSREKEEIIKMMYSIEIMQSKSEDFYKLYKEKFGIDLNNNTNELENLRLSLRTDILKTLSKEFYKSLANQISNGNLTLETTYYLINVYESDVFIHLFYNEKARIASAVEFFDYYTELQNQFFEAISKSNNIDFDDVVSGFENYSMNVSYNGNVIKNYDLSSLGEKDKKFIETKRQQNYKTGIPDIRSMPSYCKQNGYSK